MRKLLLAITLAVALVAAAAAPAGAAAANTVPLVVWCEGEETPIDVIEAQGSLVGFVEGHAVVIHKVDLVETDTVTIGSTLQVFEYDFALEAGRGSGIRDKLTVCSFAGQTLFEEDLGPLDARVARLLLRFYPELEISETDFGQNVTVEAVGTGTVWIQFPGN